MDDDSGDDVYEVEKIVDNVMVGGKTYYRVRWKNYGEDGDTWEPRENLLSCEALLNNYIRVQSEKSSGLQLPGDVFTVATGDSESEEKEKKVPGKTKRKQTKEQRKTKNTVGRKKASKIFQRRNSDSSSSDEPQVKDPFWEKLSEGKIDVFAYDLYSKVKKRRPPEKEVDASQKVQEIIPTTKGKKRGPKKKIAVVQEETNVPEKQEEKIPETTQPPEIKIENTVFNDLEEKEPTAEPSESSNVVLQYLEKEIKTKKDKKKQKSKDVISKAKNAENKQKDVLTPSKAKNEAIQESLNEPKEERRSFMNLFEESEVGVISDTTLNSAENLLIEEAKKIMTKPALILEKIRHPCDQKDDLLAPRKRVEKLTDVSKYVDAKVKDVGDIPTRNLKQKKDENFESKKTKKNKKSDFSESETDSEKPESIYKTKQSERNRRSPVDAFSAQLQESDFAATDLLIKKKSKKHIKQGRTSSPAQEKSASVLEMLTQEMEKTVTMGTSSVDPKLSQLETVVKDTQTKMGFKLQKVTEKKVSTEIENMSEFLKIKVNFELDEISVKDVERHHEMGEPPCRLERDVSNAEFRQYIRANNYEMVHEALKSKKMMYNLEHTDSNWMTQIMYAANAGFDEIVKILAHHGAKVNKLSKTGLTSLMFAAEKGHDVICRILIAYGAYINLQTTSGDTALMKAAKNGHYMIARYLLQAGADPALKTAHGNTALQITERASFPQLSDLIRNHESEINAHVNECIHRECHNLGVRTIGLPILAARVYNIRETPIAHITFSCVLQNIPSNQGLLLFAVHGMIGSGLAIKCRMRGPCHVNAVTLNNFTMDPLMPGKLDADDCTHFMSNLIWKPGQNSLRLFISQDPLSNEKLFVSIYQCGFAD